MAIYDNGTASLAANGQVTGIGTQWTMPLTLIRVGATLVFKTEPVQIYTISEITSDTSMSVYNPNGETVPAGTGYAILTHDGISVQGLAQDVAETLRYYQSRETEVADAVDAFNNFDFEDFDSKVTQVNNQHGDVVSIGAQVSADSAQVTADKDSAAASAASALSDKEAAASSAQEAADYAASLDASNLIRKDLNFSDVEDKSEARANLDVYSKSEISILTPEMFGAIKGGTIDSTDAFRAMASEAKSTGKAMFASGSYLISASNSSPIEISTDTDFSGADFICKTNDGGNANYGNSSILFHIPQDFTDVTSSFDSVSYLRGINSTGVTGLNGFVKFESTDVVMFRNGNSSSPQLKKEVNEIDGAGTLLYDNYYTYTSRPTVLYKQFNNELKFKAPKVILDGSGIKHVIQCNRNNVNIDGLKVFSTNGGFAESFLSIEDCSRIEVDGYQLDARYNSTYQGGYATILTSCSTIGVNRMKSVDGWSGIDGNYYRGLNVRDSEVLTVGGHFSVSDIYLENCTILRHCNSMGWGTFSANNCKHKVRDSDAVEDFWTSKRDYNSSWDGIVLINNLSVSIHSAMTGYYVVSALEPKANHSHYGVCPDVVIDGLYFDITKMNSGTEIRIINLGVSSGSNFEQYQRLPQHHSVSNVYFHSGSNRFLGRTSVSIVYNARDYSSLTSTQRGLISSGAAYNIDVSNIHNMERLGKINTTTGSAVVMPMPFMGVGIKQKVCIRESDFVIPGITSLNDLTCYISNQTVNGGYYDPLYQSRVSNQYNRVYFNDVVIYDIQNEAPNFRTGLFYFTDVIFGWASQTTGSTDSQQKSIGGAFSSSSPNQVGYIKGCNILVTPPGSSIDETFKSRILSGYINAGIFTTS